jgi:hypothetical protein
MSANPPTRQRPKNLGSDRDAAIIRGALIDRLDAALPLLEVAVRQAVHDSARRGSSPEEFVRALAVAVVQRVQVALFPEEFVAAPARAGLVPPGGPPRAGRKRVDGYARLLIAVAGQPG